MECLHASCGCLGSDLPSVHICVNDDGVCSGNHERDAPATGDRFYPLQSRTDSGALHFAAPCMTAVLLACLIHPDVALLWL